MYLYITDLLKGIPVGNNWENRPLNPLTHRNNVRRLFHCYRNGHDDLDLIKAAVIEH